MRRFFAACPPPKQTLSARPLLESLRARRSLAACTQDLQARPELPANAAAYAGFDPTASKLHLGNLAQVVALSRASLYGIRPLFLVGGATARIGDPSGKQTERPVLEQAALDANRLSVAEQLQGLSTSISTHLTSHLSEYGLSFPPASGLVLDNLDFYKGMNALEFLGDVGRHFRVATLLARESVAARLSSPEGLSFTEFAYQLLQAHDFLRLYQTQVGTPHSELRFANWR